MALSLEYWRIYVESFSKLARKSEAMLEANRVLRFTYDVESMVVIASVQASMRDRSYHIRILLDTEGQLRESSCECPMANFKCSHVAAALLYGYKHASKTDVKCSWIKHPKSGPTKQTVTVSELYPASQPQYRALSRPFSEEDHACLLHKLGSLGRFTALHWVMSPEPKISVDAPVKLVEDLLMSEDYICSPSPGQWLRKALLVSQQQVHLTAEKTIGQRDNPYWAAVRKLRFTASNFSDILKAVEKNVLTGSLMKKLLSSYNLDKVAAVQWGVMHEQTAVDQYCAMGGHVTKTGIWLHETGVLAAPPDGLVNRAPSCAVHGDSSTSPQLLEVKCPYSVREMTVAEAADNKPDFCLGVNNDQLFLKEGHSYWHQIQGQLHITGYDVADLVVWTSKDLQIVRINKDARWMANISRMIDFYFNKFLPAITSKS